MRQHARVELCQCSNNSRLDEATRSSIAASYARKFARYQHHYHRATLHRKRHHRVHDTSQAFASSSVSHQATAKKHKNDFIQILEQEFKHFVILLEVQSLLSGIMRIWLVENGNIGLWDFWSSLLFTLMAIGGPFFFLYVFAPWLIAHSADNIQTLSNYACRYGSFWILLAFTSILNIT